MIQTNKEKKNVLPKLLLLQKDNLDVKEGNMIDSISFLLPVINYICKSKYEIKINNLPAIKNANIFYTH